MYQNKFPMNVYFVAFGCEEAVFSEYGVVRNISRDEMMVGEVAVQTGVRRVKLVVTERQRRDVPHVINFADGHAILIVMPGRSPVCLGCGTEGHTRAWTGCPMRVERARFGGKRGITNHGHRPHGRTWRLGRVMVAMVM